MVIFVGNLSTDTKERDVRDWFEPYGEVGGMKLMRDEISGRPLGFGFVEMPNRTAARKAVAARNRTILQGATVIVCETAPRVERRRATRKRSARARTRGKDKG